MKDCKIPQYNMGIQYIAEENLYGAFCIKDNNILNFIRLDEDYTIKDD